MTTGWCRLCNDALFQSGEAWFQLAGEIVRDHCRASREPLVGWESFTIDPQTHRRRGSAEALHVIGAARWLALDGDAEILAPGPRRPEKLVPAEMLRALGWYKPGLGHANDAARQLVAWLMRTDGLTDIMRSRIRVFLEEKEAADERPDGHEDGPVQVLPGRVAGDRGQPEV